MGTKELYTPDEVQATRQRLIQLLDEGSGTVYTLVTEVSRTRETRWVRVLIPVMLGGNPQIMEITSSVEIMFNQATGDRRGIKITGTGMDVTQYLTQRLSYALYGTNDSIGHRGL